MTLSSHDETEDEALLRAFALGDVPAFDAFVGRHHSALHAFVFRMVREPTTTQDIVQETFLRVVTRASEYRGEARPKTWLFTIARNLCTDHLRKQKHRRHASLDAPAGGHTDTPLVERLEAPDARFDAARDRRRLGEAVEEAVSRLPDEQREVFLLRHVEDLPFQDIARLCEIPENTAKSRMRYALERLRSMLAEYEDWVREKH